jgi:hypothetical protein
MRAITLEEGGEPGWGERRYAGLATESGPVGEGSNLAEELGMEAM